MTWTSASGWPRFSAMRSASARWAVPLMIFMGNGMAWWPGGPIVDGNKRDGNTLLPGFGHTGDSALRVVPLAASFPHLPWCQSHSPAACYRSPCLFGRWPSRRTPQGLRWPARGRPPRPPSRAVLPTGRSSPARTRAPSR